MEKPEKYTFEDWLVDRQYYEPWERIDLPVFPKSTYEDAIGLNPEPLWIKKEEPLGEDDPTEVPVWIEEPVLSFAQKNYLIHNIPVSLRDYGVLDEDEYQKIVGCQKSAYRLALDILFKQVEPYLNSYLKKDNTINQMLIKKRLKEIESFFESVDSNEFQKAVSGELLELAVDGPTYKQFMESQDISLVIRLLFKSNTAPGIQSALPGYKRHPSLQILLRVLLEERNQLLIRSEQLNLTAETILDKYEEFKNDASAPKATEKLRSWLVDELKLPVEHVQRVYDITIDSEALRQRLHRRRKSKSKKS